MCQIYDFSRRWLSLVGNSPSARITRYQSRASNLLSSLRNTVLLHRTHTLAWIFCLLARSTTRGTTPSPLSPEFDIPSFPRADSSKRYLHKLGATMSRAKKCYKTFSFLSSILNNTIFERKVYHFFRQVGKCCIRFSKEIQFNRASTCHTFFFNRFSLDKSFLVPFGKNGRVSRKRNNVWIKIYITLCDTIYTCYARVCMLHV